MAAAARVETSTTFTPNQRLPVHRWFRYSAGFSAEWALAEIARRAAPGCTVFDPFAGSGTTLICAQQSGCVGVGVEAHPFILRVARAKLAWSSSEARFLAIAREILDAADRTSPASTRPHAALLEQIFDADTLGELERLYQATVALRPKRGDEAAKRLSWLALMSILRPCAHAGTAPWQYVLPKKRKARPADPRLAFSSQIELMADDMRALRTQTENTRGPKVTLRRDDARTCSTVPTASVDLVLTSPPYPNNYDYADAARIELSFLGQVARWADLHDAVRKHLVRSCSQHAARERLSASGLLSARTLRPIRQELGLACRHLAERRRERTGHKAYDSMAAAYFLDMAHVLKALRRVVRRGGHVCLVVGDSAPYGVHLPVERWLAQLAEATGFVVDGFDQTRLRNVKWKNRKHRVPLKEGRLWLHR